MNSVDFCLSTINRYSLILVKKLPINIYHIWKEYGKEMLLILYLAVVGFLFSVGYLSGNPLESAYVLLLFFLLILWITGKDACDFLLVVVKYSTFALQFFVF